MRRYDKDGFTTTAPWDIKFFSKCHRPASLYLSKPFLLALILNILFRENQFILLKNIITFLSMSYFLKKFNAVKNGIV